jgi:hypothetical protein
MNFIDKILAIDRRWIYVLVLFAVAIPLLKPIGLPISFSPPVQQVFDKINSLPEGSSILLSFDFGPGSAPELEPMAYAILRHCFAKGIKVIVMTLNADGASLGENIVSTVVEETNKERSSKPELKLPPLEKGKDYSYLGYKVGVAIAIMNLGVSFTKTFPADYASDLTANQSIFKKVRKLSDLNLMIPLSSSATPEAWIAYGKEMCKFDMAIGCTGISAAQYYPYLNSKQILGLIGGLKGAAEYEKLVVESGAYPEVGKATKGMDAQSIVHLMTVIMVIFTNIIFLNRKR